MSDTASTMLDTLESYHAAREDARHRNTVLLCQVGSKACPRCPPVAEGIAALQHEFNFASAYCDANASELPEHFSISRLPAVVLAPVDGTAPIVVANATLEDVTIAVRAHCCPLFTTDAEF